MKIILNKATFDCFFNCTLFLQPCRLNYTYMLYNDRYIHTRLIQTCSFSCPWGQCMYGSVQHLTIHILIFHSSTPLHVHVQAGLLVTATISLHIILPV